MPEHDRSVDCSGRRREPAACDPRIEQLVGGRTVIPHGDRVDRAQSGRIEAQIGAVGAPDEHIVRIFVLHDHVDEVGAMCPAPHQQLLDGGELVMAHVYGRA